MSAPRRPYRLNPHIRPAMLYDMCQDPDWWPYLDLIAMHPNAWPDLRAWIGRVHTAGSVESEPVPPEPPTDRPGLVGRLLAPRSTPRPPEPDDETTTTPPPPIGDSAEDVPQAPASAPDDADGTAGDRATVHDPVPNEPAQDGPDGALTVEPVRPHHHAMILAVAMACAIVLTGLAGTIAWRAYAGHRAARDLEEASALCAQARADAVRAVDEWNTVAAQARTLHDTSKGKVQDDETRAALEKELEPVHGATPACPAGGIDIIRSTARTNTRTTHTATEHTDALRQAINAVNASQTAKTLTDARAALDKRVTEARKLYDSSKGKVADGKTRDALKQQLDAAAKLKDAKDVKELKDARAALDKAMDAVNQSVNAKETADRKAAEEQAQREAEMQAAAPQPQQAVPQPAMPSPVVPVQPVAPSNPAPAQPAPQPSVQEPAPSWSVPAPTGDGALSDRDPGL